MNELYFNGMHLYFTGAELVPTNNRKSFYGKCKMYKNEEGVIFLKSYETIVCSYNPKTGIFNRLWGGYSDTTKNHVNSFRFYNGLNAINKSEWLAMEV